jgi:hypothetical protein
VPTAIAAAACTAAVIAALDLIPFPRAVAMTAIVDARVGVIAAATVGRVSGWPRPGIAGGGLPLLRRGFLLPRRTVVDGDAGADRSRDQHRRRNGLQCHARSRCATCRAPRSDRRGRSSDAFSSGIGSSIPSPLRSVRRARKIVCRAAPPLSPSAAAISS